MRRLLLALARVLPASAAFAQPGDWTYRGRSDGVHLRVLRDYHLPRGKIAREPIIVIGGSAIIEGRADDDVVAIGGTVRLGPEARVGGDAVAVGGPMIVAPGAGIDGTLDEVAATIPGFGAGLPRLGGGFWAAAAFGATIGPVTFSAGLAGLVIEYLAWTVGLGAAIMSLLGPRQRSGSGGRSFVHAPNSA